MRGVLDSLEVLEALHEAGLPTPLDNARRIIVFVVNSLSSPPTNWDESESPPGTVDILLKSAGTPIDAFSYEAIELLKDTAARWQTMRLIRNSAAYAANKDPAVAAALRVPDAEIYAIDVSFPALKDKAELDYLNRQPTSFVLPRRGRRSPARRGGDDHHGLARIPAAAEGCGRQDRHRTTDCRDSGDSTLTRAEHGDPPWRT